MTAILVSGILIFAILAVFLKDLLKAVICLLISSIFLGIVFFRLNAPFAGVFEISVVAGLIMVLFILAISLTDPRDCVIEPGIPLILFFILLAVSVYFGGGVISNYILEANISVRPYGREGRLI